jgi:hypothetical protein
MKKSLLLILLVLASILPIQATQYNIGDETIQTLPSPAYWYRVIGNWPDSNSVAPYNPPIFKWVYDEQINLTASNDVRYFQFQLSTNSTPFSAMYWDIACSNNFYNFLPPITNNSGVTYAGPCYWRIGYYNSNKVFITYGQTNIFRISPTATLWDRSMLADTNYLLSIATNHPHMYFTWTNTAAVASFLRTTPWTFHSQSWSTITNTVATYYQVQTWWTNESILTNGGINLGLGAIQGAANCAFSYYGSGSNATFHISEACSNLNIAANIFRQTGADFQDPYAIDPGAEQTMALAYDWLYPFMTANQRTNVAGILRSLVYYGAYGGDCFYGSANFTPTNRDYPAVIFAVPHESVFKLGSSHNRHTMPVCTMACVATMGEDPNTLAWFNMFENYSIFQLDPYLGDEGRGYSEQANFKFDREFSANMESIIQFPNAHLERNPLLTNMSYFFASWEPMGYKGVLEPWGDLSFNFIGQWYNYRYHDVANITGDGGILRKFKRTDASFRFSGSDEFPVLGEAFLRYYFPDPVEADMPTNSYFDPIRGWVMAGNLPPTDYAAFTNGVNLVVQARPGGRNVDHGSFTDGQFDLTAFGAICTAGGSALGYAKHPMYYDTLMVNGIGTHMSITPPTDPVYAWFPNYTNCPDYTYAAADITKAMARTNFFDNGLGNMAGAFYQWASNSIPQVSKIRRHFLFPHKRYLVIYDECQTTTNSTFQFIYHIAETNSTVDTNNIAWHYTSTNIYNGSNVTTYVVPFASPTTMGLLNMYGTNYAKYNPFTKENYFGLDDDTGPYYSSTIWVTNQTATTNWHFGFVVYPARWDQAAPTITRVSDNTVTVSDGTYSDGISFAETNATVQANVSSYFVLNTFNASTNSGGGGGGGGDEGGGGGTPGPGGVALPWVHLVP